MPRPELVGFDLVGSPDVRSAIAKLRAWRNALMHAVPKGIAAPSSSGPGGPSTKTKKPSVQLLDADLRSDNGNLSAQLIADLYDVPLASVGTWIDRKKGTIWKTPDADSIQGQLQPLSDIALIRVALPGNENCRKWLRTRREMLHSKSPLEWIESGSMRDIAGFVHDALTGQPT